MKAERRQELKTNDLAQMIEDARQFFRNWGSYLVGGVAVIVLVVAFALAPRLADNRRRLRMTELPIESTR